MTDPERHENYGNHRIPRIKRARGYRLYGTNGRRYIDFFQDGGRALLGHRPAGWSRIMKSTGEKGLFASYPSQMSGKAKKAAYSFFSWEGGVRVFSDLCTVRAAIAGATEGLSYETIRFVDPLLSEDEELRRAECVPLWRPFALETHKLRAMRNGEWGRWILPVLPDLGGLAACVLLDTERQEDFPLEGEVSPLSEGLLLRSLGELQRYFEAMGGDARKVLWTAFDLPGIRRRGPYLYMDELVMREYNELFEVLLGAGVLLPPRPAEPAIIPMEYTDGEVQPFIREMRRRYADR